jgi:aspartate/methionine/tyrosine aminotransferase
MTKFDYKVEAVPSEIGKAGIEELLNKFGKEGWELVSVESFNKSLWMTDWTSGFIVILKKQTNE